MNISAKKAAVRAFAGVTLAWAASTSAAATYNYFDVMADPGTYGTIALGEDISLNACGSTFHRADGSPESYSLCQLSDLTEFSLTWVGWHDGDWTSLGYYSGNNADDGVGVDVSTGDGTFFSEVGTYYIGLYLQVEGDTYVPLPGGGWGRTGNDNDLADDGSTNFSYAWSSAFSIEEAVTSVPEPLGALLLLPGFAYLARRERRRKQQLLA
jgi:hypothetical protein